MSETYRDDRPGMMRVHISDERGRLACARYRLSALRSHARAHGVSPSGRKTNLAWYMAQHGLIDAQGNLRDGFPATSSEAV